MALLWRFGYGESRVGLIPKRFIPDFEKRYLAVECSIDQSEGRIRFEESVDIRSRTVPVICVSIWLVAYLVACVCLLIAGVIHLRTSFIEPLLIIAFVAIIFIVSRTEAKDDECTIYQWRADLLNM